MRILYSHYLATEEHPATRMVHTIANELRSFGHEAVVHRSQAEETSTISLGSTSTKKPRFGGLRKKLWFTKALSKNQEYLKRDRAILERFKPDVVLCRNDAYCYSMPKACREKKVPLVTYSDAPAAFEARRFNASGRWHPPMLLERIEKWVLQQSSGVVTVSNPAKALLERYKTRTPIAVAHNGVDSAMYRPLTAEEKSAIRYREGASRPLIAGFVGSFRAFHGMNLLKDLIRTSADRTDLEWWLIGDGTGRNQLEADLRGLSGVRFFGSRPPHEIPALLASFDVSIIPHEIMGKDFYFCPLKILESMACGVPCIASRQGDIPELLDAGVPINLMERSNPNEWHQALARLLDSWEEIEALSTANRLKAETCYSWQNTARKVEAVLNDAVSHHGSSSLMKMDEAGASKTKIRGYYVSV